MDVTDIRSPRLRQEVLDHEEFYYNIEHVIRLPIPDRVVDVPLSTILASRRSRREFSPVDLETVSIMLWSTSKVCTLRETTGGLKWQHRPVPSPGGLHAGDILVAGLKGRDQSEIYLYDPIGHSLGKVGSLDEATTLRFLSAINDVVPSDNATLLWSAVQWSRLACAYEDPISLIYRDVGNLHGFLSLVSEGMGLNCCQVGITGEPWLSEMLGASGRVVGGGGVVVGFRPVG